MGPAAESQPNTFKDVHRQAAILATNGFNTLPPSPSPCPPVQRDAVSPVTRQPLPSALLFPNVRLRGLTEDLHALLRLVEGRQQPGGG